MPDDVTFKLDPDSRRRFVRTLREVVKVTGRSASQAVIWASIRFSMAGRARSKVGKKWRTIEQNPDANSKRFKYRVTFKSQDGPDTYRYTNQKRPQFREIKRRGLAKDSWRWLLAALGKSRGTLTSRGRSKWAADVKDRSKSSNPEVELVNRLGYITLAFPGIQGDALTSATNAMKHSLERTVKRQMQRAWRGR